MEDLTQAAQLARTSLKEHPDLTNPYAIFLGPVNQQRMSAGEIEHGLRELEAARLATKDFYGWRLIDPPPEHLPQKGR
ncbi:MAG: hypothetical protein ACRDLL_03590 [Solirubrobacterales bacterium]